MQIMTIKYLGSVWFESFGGERRGGEIFNLKCLVQFIGGEGGEMRGANFITLSKLSLD